MFVRTVERGDSKAERQFWREKWEELKGSVSSFTKFYRFIDFYGIYSLKFTAVNKFYGDLSKALNSIKCSTLSIVLRIFTDLQKFTGFTDVNLRYGHKNNTFYGNLLKAVNSKKVGH